MVVITLWSFASTYAWCRRYSCRPRSRCLKALGTLSTTGYVDSTLWQHAGASLGRVFAALVASVAIAVPVGVAIAASPVGRGILDPLVEFLRPLPPLAYLPLVIIWFGIGEPSKVLVISLAMIPPIAISTASGVRSASQSQINAARSFGASRLQVLRHVLLPSALPAILTGIRIALGNRLVDAGRRRAGRRLARPRLHDPVGGRSSWSPTWSSLASW